MPNYEYTTEVLTHGFLGRKEEELDRQEFQERLNALGAEGWEFEKLLTHMALHGEKDGHVLIFKREAALERAAGDGGRGRVRALLAELLAREVLLGQQRVVARALDDAQEVGHRRDLLDLLLDEPLHELLRRVVALLARDAGQRVDLLGHALLLLERERDRADDVVELDCGATTPGTVASTSWSTRYCTIIIAWLRSSSACA
jgi:hypothetical protein